LGFLDYFANLKKSKEIEIMFDLDLLTNKSQKIYMKKLALDICINFLARTISLSEFRIKDGKNFIKDELYYRLNIQPNKNMTGSMFWQTVIYKLIYDNECLVIQADDGDLLIADDFVRHEYAVYEDRFTNVIVKDWEFKRTYTMDEVVYLEYNNQNLTPLINELFTDYGELFGSILKGQKRKNQIRSTVKIDKTGSLTKEDTTNLQDFINKIYKAIEEKDVAVVPEQKGFEYKEHTAQRANTGQSVDEVNKVTGGFLDQVAMALGIPPGLIRGEMADNEKQVKSYMTFGISPFIKKLQDESNVKFIEKEDYMNGKQIVVRKLSTRDIFELATAVDKLRSSGTMNGHELRDEMNLERSDDPIHDKYFITKNYGTLEGGEDN
jgi:HK97 family phage portal protein